MKSPYYSTRRVWMRSSTELLDLDGKTLTVFHLDGKSHGHEATLHVRKCRVEGSEPTEVSISYSGPSTGAGARAGEEDGHQHLTASGVAAVVKRHYAIPGRGYYSLQVPVV
jgi:hypothetical protein